jgi:hypothetical protein
MRLIRNIVRLVEHHPTFYKSILNDPFALFMLYELYTKDQAPETIDFLMSVRCTNRLLGRPLRRSPLDILYDEGRPLVDRQIAIYNEYIPASAPHTVNLSFQTVAPLRAAFDVDANGQRPISNYSEIQQKTIFDEAYVAAVQCVCQEGGKGICQHVPFIEFCSESYHRLSGWKSIVNKDGSKAFYENVNNIAEEEEDVGCFSFLRRGRRPR